MVVEKSFDSARDFLDALDLSRPEWTPTDSHECPWVFRGQWNADWGLRPSAWREENSSAHSYMKCLREKARQVAADAVSKRLLKFLEPETEQTFVRRAAAVASQAAAEISIVREFCRLTDELGMLVPDLRKVPTEDSPLEHFALKRLEEFWHGHTPIENPVTTTVWDAPFWCNSAFALAQHHGVPTRLLDWSRESMKAAFFAIPQKLESDGRLAVWAFQTTALLSRNDIRLLTPPRSGLAFMHAQDGAFLVHKRSDAHYMRSGDWPDISQSLDPNNKGDLVKLTLPVMQARELERLLSTKRITRAHLMPAYDSVASTLVRRWESRRP